MTSTGATAPLPGEDCALAAAMLAIFCGSAGAAAFKLLTATSSGQAIAERSLIAAGVLLVWTLIHDRGHFRPMGKAALMRAVFDAIAAFTFALAIFELPLSLLTSIHMSVPLVSMVLAVAILREKVTRRQIIAALIGFAGIIIVVQPSVAFAPFGISLAIISTFAYALRDSSNRRIPLTASGSQTALLSVLLAGAAGAMLNGSSAWIVPPPTDLLAVALAAACYVASSTLIIVALRSAPLTIVSTLRYSAIFWAMMFDFFIDGSIPAPTTFFGAALVIISGLILFRPFSGRRKSLSHDFTEKK